MLTIKFKVNTKVEAYGIVGSGQIRDFEDEDYAKGLVKDGLGVIYHHPQVEPQQDEDQSDDDQSDEEGPIVLEDLDDDQLKALAKDAKIAGYTKMDRETLIAAIVAADEQGE